MKIGDIVVYSGEWFKDARRHSVGVVVEITPEKWVKVKWNDTHITLLYKQELLRKLSELEKVLA